MWLMTYIDIYVIQGAKELVSLLLFTQFFHSIKKHKINLLLI